MPTTFVAWDTQLVSLHDTLARLRKGGDVRVRPLLGDRGYGRLWDDAVAVDLAAADRVLAIVDEPNANMAFELGYALGLGKPYALLTAGEARPAWLAGALLKDLLVNPDGEDIATIRRVLADPRWGPPLPCPPPGSEPRVLLPRTRTSGTVAEQLGEAFHPRLVLDFPATLARLSESLRDVGRVAWVLPPSSVNKRRHGEEIAAAAVVAGYAYATGRALTVLRSKAAEPLVDVAHLEEALWAGSPVDALRAWLGDDARRYAPAVGPDPDDILGRWRSRVLATLDRAIPLMEGAGERALTEIHVELAVDERCAELPDRELPLRAFLEKHPRGAVLGEPGAGKTTSVRHLACTLAADPAAPVPVYLPLARHADKPMDPFAIVEGEHGMPGLADALRALPAGRVWLFLDGLDEVAQARMETLREQIVAFLRAHPGVTALVTGRPVVEGLRAIPEGFVRAELQPLDVERMEALVERLLGPDRAGVLVDALRADPALAELGRNPLLLSLLALVARETGAAGTGLPRRRTQLFATAIDLLLKRGYAVEPRGVRDPDLARDLLQRLSLTLQEEGGESWPRSVLAERLWDFRLEDERLGRKIDTTWGAQPALIDDIGTNSGVLGPHDGVNADWRYLHRSLREFLAAERLQVEGPKRIGKFVRGWTKAVEAFEEAGRDPERAPDPARWGEVHALLCGLSTDPVPLLKDLRQVAPALARQALRSAVLEPDRALGFLLADPGWRYSDLEGLASRHGADLHSALTALVRPGTDVRVLAFAQHVLQMPAEKLFNDAGLSMGPAPEVVRIEPGSFWMGTPEGRGGPNERPVHRVTLTEPFRVGLSVAPPDTYARLIPGTSGSSRNWYLARLCCLWVGGDLATEAELERARQAGATSLTRVLAMPEWCRDSVRKFSADPVVDPVGADRAERCVRLNNSRYEFPLSLGVGKFRVRLPVT